MTDNDWRDGLAPVLALGGPLALFCSGLAREPLAIGLAALTLGGLAWVQADAARALRRRVPEAVVWALWSLGVCLALYVPWLWAKWSIIDDHELFYLLKGRGGLSLGEAVREFVGHYEVGGFLANGLGRFRPGYYLVRYANLWLFGTEVAWWNLFDLAALWASLTLAALTLRRFLGLAETALALVGLLSLPFWPGVLFSNLQQESVAFLGLSLCAHGLARVFEGRARSLSGPWAEACLGAILAMSLKENFLALAPFLAVAAMLAWRRGLTPGRAWAWIVLALGYAALAGSILAFLLARQGADMYANPVSAQSRLPLVLPGLELFAGLANLGIVLPAMIPLLCLGLWAWRVGRYSAFPRGCRRAVLAILGCALAFAGQYVFYNGKIPMGGHRYDFPALLAPPAAWLAMAWLASRCLAVVSFGRPGRAAVRHLARALLCAALAAFAAMHGFDAWRSQLRLAVAKTRTFDARIGATAVLAKADPHMPILLTARNPDSIEAVDSVVVNLRLRFGLTNPIFLDYQNPGSLGPDQVHLRALDAELARLSRQGSADLTPIASLPADLQPLGLGLDGPPDPRAVNLGRIWPLP